MAQLRQHNAALAKNNVQVAIVTFESDYFAKQYARDTDLPWPLLVDAKRELYNAYSMGRTPMRRLLDWQTIVTYAKLMLRGRRLTKNTGDVHQLGGDVLIDPDGMIRLHYVSANPADRPAISALIQSVEAWTNHPEV